MEPIHPLADQYALTHTTDEDALLQEVARFTQANHPLFHMLSGAVQGNLLSIVSHMIQPQRILEVGTFTGYSALCLAKGLAPEGELHTIECRADDAASAQGFFDVSPQKHQIHLHVGKAADIIPTLTERWDLVFIDADKTGYIDYYELILPSVKQNGIILADNVLFRGQVLESPVSGKNALAMAAFNKHVQKDPRVQQVLLTVRDGLMMIRKLA